jgi:hypothetical protein
MEEASTVDTAEEYCTLLCVRADGVVPFVDLEVWTELADLRERAKRLLREHQSCDAVEVWRGGTLLDRIVRD